MLIRLAAAVQLGPRAQCKNVPSAVQALLFL